jgi:hypothetical protein
MTVQNAIKLLRQHPSDGDAVAILAAAEKEVRGQSASEEKTSKRRTATPEPPAPDGE